MPTQPATDVDAIAADLATLKQDVAALIANLKARTADQTEGLFDQATEQARTGAKALAREMEERPLTALLIAFAVGFAASRLLSR